MRLKEASTIVFLNLLSIAIWEGINLFSTLISKKSYSMQLNAIDFYFVLIILSVNVFYLIVRAKKTNLYNGNPPRKAIRILKIFIETGNDVLNKATIMNRTNLNTHTVQYLIDQLEGREFIESYLAFYPEDNRFVLSEKGRDFLAKKGLLK